MARIPREEHATIRERVDVAGEKVADVAAAYGCTPANIYAILSRLRRQDAAGEPATAEPDAGVAAPLAAAAPMQAAPAPLQAESPEPVAVEPFPNGIGPVPLGQDDHPAADPIATEAPPAGAALPSAPDAVPAAAAAAGETASIEAMPAGTPPADLFASLLPAEQTVLASPLSDAAAPTRAARTKVAPSGAAPKGAAPSRAVPDKAAPAAEPAAGRPTPARPEPAAAPPAAAKPSRAAATAKGATPAAGRVGRPGYALLMRTGDGEEAVNPFRSLDELLSATRPLLRTAARSPEPIWFSIQQVDLATLDDSF